MGRGFNEPSPSGFCSAEPTYVARGYDGAMKRKKHTVPRKPAKAREAAARGLAELGNEVADMVPAPQGRAPDDIVEALGLPVGGDIEFEPPKVGPLTKLPDDLTS